jgi:aldehyde dehydrogenase (NAD+)
MLVEASVFDQAVEIARRTAEEIEVGPASEEGDHIGPLAHKLQFDRVQAMIQAGIDEGARLVAGGLGRPDGLDKGYFVKPTIFADVTPDMRIVREEIFGPVLVMLPFETEEEAIAMANDTTYGLSSYISSGSAARIDRVARRLEAGMVNVNGGFLAAGSPFGGYKQSGNGREGGEMGIAEFLETKVITAFQIPQE